MLQYDIYHGNTSEDRQEPHEAWLVQVILHFNQQLSNSTSITIKQCIPQTPKPHFLKARSIVKGLKAEMAGVVDLPSILDHSATVRSRLECFDAWMAHWLLRNAREVFTKSNHANYYVCSISNIICCSEKRQVQCVPDSP